jgi:CHAT domain-containing protein/tetratricopeptide (TPR) repeat protein
MRIARLLIAVSLALPAMGLAEPPPLLPGVPVEGEVLPGAVAVFRLPEVPAQEPGLTWWISLEQQGVDVVLSVVGPEGVEVTVDNPLEREGLELLHFEPAAGESYRLEVRPRDPLAPAGRYRLVVEGEGDPAEGGGTDRGMRRRARDAVTQAGVRYHRGTPEDWRRARHHHQEAVALWGPLGESAAMARSLYALAVLSRLLGDTAEARAHGEAALALFSTLGQPRWQGYSHVELGLLAWLQGESGAAREHFQAALEPLAHLGDDYGQAVALHNLCLMDLVVGELRAGRACYEAHLPAIEAARAAEVTGAVRTNLGRVLDVLGEPLAAIGHYERALEIQRAVGDASGDARTLNNLAVLRRGLGEADQAIVLYGRALEIFQRLEDRRWQARVLGNLGAVHLYAGDLRQATASFQEALAIWRDAGDRRGEATTLSNLGSAALERGDPQEALAFYQQSLALRRALGDGVGEARALARLAQAQVEAGDGAAAARSFEAALAGLREAGDRPHEALALLDQGRLLLQQGQVEQARAALAASVRLAREIGDRSREVRALEGLARVEAAAGHGAAALQHVQQAVEILDGLRGTLRDPDLGVAFSRSRHRVHALAVELLMEGHRRDPAAGLDLRALEAAEGARARTLLTMLAEAGAPVEGAVDPLLAQQRRQLLQRLSGKSGRALTLPPGSAERLALEAERLQLLRELDLVEARLREASPAFAALTAPEPLEVAAIQGLLDPGTLLLSYFLGEERSFLWVVSRQAVRSIELPPRGALEGLARTAHGLLSDPHPSHWRREAAVLRQLAHLLLEPAAVETEGVTRLAIIGDGALRYLPFGALPRADGEPFLTRFEVVYLPSASALAALRQGRRGPSPGAGRLAILADPVFRATDPRVSPEGPPVETAGSRGGEDFPRLPASRREAETLAALVPQGEALTLVDFAADRQAVLEGRLDGFEVLHFATHGVLDTSQPALSGLVLSQVGPDGAPRAGFLGLHDIYGLDLRAELVVLSGCRTALGEEMRGEGLVGLTRGFMYAGTPRVVASLWPVEDRATADLMELFYRALWEENLPAAAALRRAQQTLRQERRWRDPYYWAGFLLQGEWR